MVEKAWMCENCHVLSDDIAVFRNQGCFMTLAKSVDEPSQEKAKETKPALELAQSLKAAQNNLKKLLILKQLQQESAVLESLLVKKSASGSSCLTCNEGSGNSHSFFFLDWIAQSRAKRGGVLKVRALPNKPTFPPHLPRLGHGGHAPDG